LDHIFINTCSITKKADIESIGLIRRLHKKYPNAHIIVSGCANLKDVSTLNHVTILDNQQKETHLENLNCAYTHQILDKFSHTNRFLLKVQSGCTAFCTYCTVPYKRPYLWSLPIDTAVDTVNKAVSDGYKEVIITGVNLNQYTPGFSNIVEALLTKTKIPLISFGSIPVNCIDNQFISLYSGSLVKGNSPTSSRGEGLRLSSFLHIPLQSGSDKILKLMHRSYNTQEIKQVFLKLQSFKAQKQLTFGTDIIVGFPGETETDFQQTYDLCQNIGFTKIHVFKYSPRPGTTARQLFLESQKISKDIVKLRSQKLRQITFQTTPPFHQIPDTENSPLVLEI